MSLTTTSNPTPGLPDHLALPKMPDMLTKAFQAYRSTGATPGYPPNQAMVIAARTTLLDLRALQTPVSEQRLRDWLKPILVSVRNTRDVDEVRVWFAAVMIAMEDVPAVCFNRATMKDAIRHIDFFPSAADLYRHIVDDKVTLMQLRNLCEMIIHPTPPA